jgi:uncharacterized protein (TIGR04255 family)
VKIPSKIDPCPITEAIMEIRFESSFDEAAVFGIVYSQLKDEFEKTLNLPVLELPASIRKTDPSLTFQPYYRLVSKVNKNALIQVGPRVFSVVITNSYTTWKDFLSDIDYGLSKLEQSKVVSKVSRLGLRYLNFFEGNILTKSNLVINLSDQNFNSNKCQLRIEIPAGDFMNVLSVHNNAIMQTQDGIKIGSIIDIDTSVEKELPDFFNTRKKLLEDCHSIEKQLFSSLMSEEYVQTLKEIKYV